MINSASFELDVVSNPQGIESRLFRGRLWFCGMKAAALKAVFVHLYE